MLDYFKRRREMKEIERELEARRGEARIRRHITKQRRMARKLWDLGKRALEIGDRRNFRSIAKQYLWTLDDIRRWERNLLTFEAIRARRDQARSTAEFMRSIQAMSRSILVHADQKEMARMQKELELAIARAQNLEQMMDYVMEMTDETVFEMEEIEDERVEEALRELEREMLEAKKREAPEAAEANLDSRIEEGLRRIEEEMRKELKK